jgi:hypothetical protein
MQRRWLITMQKCFPDSAKVLDVDAVSFGIAINLDVSPPARNEMLSRER